MAKTKQQQIFEAAQTAYDAFKKMKSILDQSIRAQGVEPKAIKKKTEGVFLDPKSATDKDAMVAAVLLKKFEKEMKATSKSNTKATQSLMHKPRITI